MKMQKFFVLAVATLTSVLNVCQAHADGTQSNAQINVVRANADGSLLVTLTSPSSNLTSDCLLGVLTIPANAVAKTTYVSELLTAKASQLPVSISYTGSNYSQSCTIDALSL